MTTSSAVLEIRKIREELHHHHLSQTPEDIEREYEKAIASYEKATGKPLRRVAIQSKV